MTDTVFRHAGWFWTRALPILGGHAITIPAPFGWSRVYLLPHVFDNETTRRHERVHLEQIERDGVIKFSVQYLYWCLRYGYRLNPYEIEAYRQERGNDDVGPAG
jgi:hypothetical protein